MIHTNHLAHEDYDLTPKSKGVRRDYQNVKNNIVLQARRYLNLEFH